MTCLFLSNRTCCAQELVDTTVNTRNAGGVELPPIYRYIQLLGVPNFPPTTQWVGVTCKYLLSSPAIVSVSSCFLLCSCLGLHVEPTSSQRTSPVMVWAAWKARGPAVSPWRTRVRCSCGLCVRGRFSRSSCAEAGLCVPTC